MVRPAVLSVLLTALLAFSGAAEAASLPRLGHHGRWVTDADGRVVTLHGWNMVNKRPPYAPDAVGFGDDDARFLADQGFNSVRLGLTWKAVEPRPGVYDQAYLDRIARTYRALHRRGVFVLLDFHQDLYNERYQGNGAPDWAIVGRAAQEGRGVQAGFPSNYLVNDQLNHAYDAFWNNTPVPGTGRGVQDHYAAAWAQVAQRFRRSPGIAGYNLFNEPWQGTDVQRCAFAGKATSPDGDCPAANEFDRTKLTSFHRRVIAAIRGADRRTLAWWAPVLTFDFGLRTSHGDTGDRNAGFAFNSYCGQADPLTATILPFARGKPCSYTAELTFDNAEIVRRRTGDALLNTEYGASDDAKNWIDYAAAADRHMVGWHYWAYCGCNDPTTSAQPPDAQGVVLDPARPPSGANVKQEKLRQTARPYPSLVSGVPRRWKFRPNGRQFRLLYSTHRLGTRRRWAPGAVTKVKLPAANYPGGYSVDVRGARVASPQGARTLRLRSCRGARAVSVRIRPGGSTPRAERRC